MGLRQNVDQRPATDAVDCARPSLLAQWLGFAREGLAVEDLRGAKALQIRRLGRLAGGRDDAISQLGQDGDRDRSDAARGSGDEDVTALWGDLAVFQRQDAEHGGKASRADGHRIARADRVRQLDEPVSLDRRTLRVAAIVRVAQPPSGGDDLVASNEAGIGRPLDRSGKVDPGDQREGLDDLRADEGKRVLIVYVGPFDRDRNIAVLENIVLDGRNGGADRAVGSGRENRSKCHRTGSFLEDVCRVE
nr:hypothetical protein [Sphingomonas glacialis]